MNELAESSTTLIVQLNDDDVLQGRGNRSVTNKGNIRFRALVKERKVEYTATSGYQGKDAIARQIASTIKDRGGRFLKQTSNPELSVQGWIEVTEEICLEKIKQTMRDLPKQEEPPRNRQGVETPEDIFIAAQQLRQHAIQQAKSTNVSQDYRAVAPAVADQGFEGLNLLRRRAYDLQEETKNEANTMIALLDHLPKVYYDLLSPREMTASLQFTSEDLSWLLRAKTRAVSEGNIQNLTLIHQVLTYVLKKNLHYQSLGNAELVMVQHAARGCQTSILLAAQQREQLQRAIHSRQTSILHQAAQQREQLQRATQQSLQTSILQATQQREQLLQRADFVANNGLSSSSNLASAVSGARHNSGAQPDAQALWRDHQQNPNVAGPASYHPPNDYSTWPDGSSRNVWNPNAPR